MRNSQILEITQRDIACPKKSISLLFKKTKKSITKHVFRKVNTSRIGIYTKKKNYREYIGKTTNRSGG